MAETERYKALILMLTWSEWVELCALAEQAERRPEHEAALAIHALVRPEAAQGQAA